MLQVKDIRKKYVTGDLEQTALDGVSLNLRDSEFVAILGPSGSGKTTLLNVIGGLDRYDSGDLVINGISTKRYKDRDWDSYRNHTVGFVFQSYNLIPHQSVLSNVELALTISGVSHSERRRRATEALQAVGLGEQLHKRPSQMSGGQMQRVAIARALVNDPDILLADEPTGALDTDTSVAVMDLLREVANDRLVVMVTHNPELAEQYATRIVRLRDGRIEGDTDPYVIPEGGAPTPEHRTMGRASMSFLTALPLSFNNLLTKKGRTLLTAFAGSIGIIGIALILSLSNGVNDYIEGIERDTMGNYPIELEKETINLESMMESAPQGGPDGEGDTGHGADAVYSNNVVGDTVAATKDMMTRNNLGAFKAYYDREGDALSGSVSAVEYGYAITPQVYSLTDDGAEQVSPASIETGDGSVSGGMAGMGMSSMSASTSTAWAQLPRDGALREANYELLAGEWPQGADEAALVVSPDNEVSDFVLYTLGLMDRDHMDEVVAAAEDGAEVDDPQRRFGYDEVLGLEYRVLAPCQLYYEEDGVWVDGSDDDELVAERAAEGRTVRISAVLRAGENADVTSGVVYTGELTDALMLLTEQSDVVQAQLADPGTNVLTGEAFEDEEDEAENGEDENDSNGTEDSGNGSMTSQAALASPSAGSAAFGATATPAVYRPQAAQAKVTGSATARLALDSAGDANGTSVPSSSPEPSSAVAESSDVDSPASSSSSSSSGSSGVTVNPDDESPSSSSSPSESPDPSPDASIEKAPERFTVTFKNYDGSVLLAAKEYESGSDVTALPAKDPERPSDAASSYTFIGWKSSATNGVYATADLPKVTQDVEYTAFYYASPVKDESQTSPTAPTDPNAGSTTPGNGTATPGGTPDAGSGMPDGAAIPGGTSMPDGANASGMSGFDASGMDASALASQYGVGASGMDMSAMGASGADMSGFGASGAMELTDGQLAVLLAQMSDSTPSTYEDVLEALGRSVPEEPSSIKIYPVDFDGKQQVEDFIAAYNGQAAEADQVTYTDMVGLMVSSVTSIVDMISYVLIAFVAVSLVVSSIMIGIITYISVLERTKEIGILRAIGASKRNVSQVFNAETFIVGLLSGLLGIGITLLLLVPGNAAIHALTGAASVNAALPMTAAAALIALSVALTLIGGLIPARSAAKKDPVAALRAE